MTAMAIAIATACMNLLQISIHSMIHFKGTWRFTLQKTVRARSGMGNGELQLLVEWNPHSLLSKNSWRVDNKFGQSVF